MDTSSSNDKRAQEGGDATTPSAKKKKVGELKLDVTGGDDNYLVPLRLTARSGYLSVKEVARLLLFTGKSFMGTIFEDAIDSVGQESAKIPLTNPAQTTEDDGPYRFVRNVQLTRNKFTGKLGLIILGSSGQDYHSVKYLCGEIMVPRGTIQPGDRVVALDGKDTKGLSYESLMKKLAENKSLISFRRKLPAVNDQIWKCICEHKWKNGKTLAKLTAVVGFASDGSILWEGLFRKFLEDPPEKEASIADQTSFLISLHHTNDKDTQIACQFIEGENAKSLMKYGITQSIEFDSPIFVGKYDLRDCKIEPKNFRISLHALRKSDRKACFLGAQYVQFEPSELGPEIDPSKLFLSGFVELSEVPPDNSFVKSLQGHVLHIESIHMRIKQQLRAKIEKLESDSQGLFSVYITGVQIQCIEMDMESDLGIMRATFPSTESSWLRNHITLEHFLKKMDGWK